MATRRDLSSILFGSNECGGSCGCALDSFRAFGIMESVDLNRPALLNSCLLDDENFKAARVPRNRLSGLVVAIFARIQLTEMHFEAKYKAQYLARAYQVQNPHLMLEFPRLVSFSGPSNDWLGCEPNVILESRYGERLQNNSMSIITWKIGKMSTKSWWGFQ